ncbi:hypothetical protein MMC10_002025 [Thelotrema lepadinum]|nr:hypothetical protein [Thelotrema lepadinum]
MDSDHISNAVVPPSPAECEGYYYGLIDPPALVARSSQQTRPWKPRFNSSSQVGKALDTLGNHPIVNLWNKIRAELKKPLSRIIYGSLDVIRIGYQDEDSRKKWPLVLWIGTSRGSVSWKEAQACVLDCAVILGKYKMNDVECEIMESGSKTMAYGLPPLRIKAPSTHHKHDFGDGWASDTLTPGHALGDQNPPNSGGTLGLFLDPDDRRIVLGLTCRHVMYPRKEPLHTDTLKTANLLREKVWWVQPSSEKIGTKRKRTVRELDEDGQDTAETGKQKWARYRASIEIKPGAINPFPSGKCQFLGSIVAASAPLNSLSALRLYKEKGIRQEPRERQASTLPKDTTSGPPPREGSEDVTGIRWQEDWCVFHVEARCDTSLSNEIYIGEVSQPVREKMAEDPAFDEAILRSLSMKLSFNKRSMLPFPEKGEGSKSLHSRRVVGKRGAITNTTWGMLNEIRSLMISYDHGGSGGSLRAFETEHLCILPIGRELFAASGDSGAAIFDLRGQAVGMLTCGLFGGGIEYADQIEWILDAVGEKLGYTVQIN